ncbi:MAG: kelch repeat-containing protein [Steroidobacteraceae bacterium]|jgi:N-acetylneuraminic acid mutarotase
MRTIGLRTLCLVGFTLILAACGGGSSSSDSTAVSTNYTVGGTISGLAVSGVVLANGSATVTVLAGASSWQFPATFPAGSSYSVTVKTQPTGELCAVTSGGSGTDTGSVGNVTVVCGFGQWTWQGDPNTVNGGGIYGTQGSPASSNLPGARYSASSWTESGNLWLFGGVGYDSTGATGYLSDLWQYSPSTRQWTWVSGGIGDNASGVYGTQGVAAAGNVPGARYDSSSWADSSGNLWLFGGYGYDSTGALGPLNDLWRFTPSSGQWTWIGGEDIANAYGVYGTQGTAAAANVPGARYSASTSVDSSGNLWLFGGYGSVSATVGGAGRLNDLWRYSPSSGQWTWVGGLDAPNASGVYGTAGTAAAGNAPGARYAANIWIDSTSNVWLFGGYGYDSTGAVGKLNDLWKYSPGSGQWTWITGVDVANATAFYGTLGAAASTNQPGARYSATSWIDSSGNLWLFGGYGDDSTGSVGNLNDLWRYNPASADWTWLSGGYTDNASGVYGTAGTAAASNVPGARYDSNSWVDSSGNFWLFGGSGYDSNGSAGYLNDLWQFNPSAGT